MRIHKYAEYFPILEGDEFDMLVKDIKENGQNEPVVMYQGEVLDGVNRSRACEVLGIEPKAVEYGGNDPLKYVISSNIRRRHLSASQKAMIGTEMLPVLQEEAADRKAHRSTAVTDLSRDKRGYATSAHQVADVFGVGRRTVESAARVKKLAPERVAEVVKGDVSVDSIDVEMRKAEAEKRASEKTEKVFDKALEENKRFVSEYFKEIKAFTQYIEIAITGAKRGKFDPQAKNFVITKHDAVRKLMGTLEESI